MTVPDSQIVAVRFRVRTSYDVKKQSCVELKNGTLFQGDKPYPNGLHDAHLGTTDSGWDCETCYGDKRHCPGHYGHLILRTNVLLPQFITQAYNILKNVCYECGRYTGNKKDCSYCSAKQPTYSRTPSNPFVFNIDYDGVRKKKLYPIHLYHIFSRIIPDDIPLIGYPASFQPISIVPNILTISPNSIRPDAKILTSNKHNSNDMTILIRHVIDVNNKINTDITPDTDITSDISDQIMDLCISVYEMIRGPYQRGSTQSTSKTYPGAPLNKIQSKKGDIRRRIMGKQVENEGRAIIVCNTRLENDQIGIPKYIARSLKRKVVVCDYNYEECLTYYLNGSTTYPGASHLIRGGLKKYTDIVNKTSPLQIGDILFRDIIDNDTVTYNRQPSLEITSITSMHVIVTENSVFEMNVSACSLFNADFDGDAMVVSAPLSHGTEFETRLLLGLARNIVTAENTTIKISETLDSIIGLSELTRNDTRFIPYHYMNLIANLPGIPDYVYKDVYYGRESITAYLRYNRLHINFNRIASIGQQLYRDFINIPDDDVVVKIHKGELQCGVLDKNSIGEGVKYNIFHTIFNQYGYRETQNASYYMQQLGLHYIRNCRAFSVSFRDFYVNDVCRREIMELLRAPIDNSNVLWQNALSGLLIPPFGQTLDQYYETLQMNNLETNDYIFKVLLSHIGPHNRLFKSIATGAKGKIFNLKNILSNVGQLVVGGTRIKRNFSYGRTSPYLPRFDESARARGFVPESYAIGLSPLCFIYHTEDSRESIVRKALQTATAGTRQRKDMKSMDAFIVTYTLRVESDTRILQFLYGYDGFILNLNEQDDNRLFTPSLTDKTFRDEFHADNLGKNKPPADMQKLFDTDYQELLDLRRRHMHRYLKSNKVNFPFNISNIISSLSVDDIKAVPLDPFAAYDTIKSYTRDLVYIYRNSMHKQLQTRLPPHFEYGIREIVLYIRSYMNLSVIIRNRIDNKRLKLILDVIELKLTRALMTPGTPIGSRTPMCVNRVMTQEILDSHHRSGAGQSRSFVEKVNEIFTCRNTCNDSTASMRIYLTDDVQCDNHFAKMMAYGLEMLLLDDVVASYQLIVEPYDPKRPDIANFESVISTRPTGSLLDICYVLYIDKLKMIIKNISAEQIYTVLSQTYPNIYVIYTSRVDEPFYFKIYLYTSIIESIKRIDLNLFISVLRDSILKTLIKGMRNITSACVQEESLSFVSDDGSVASKKIYCIQTAGTNLREILLYDKVDKLRTYSDSLSEMKDIYGIYATRYIIHTELTNNLSLDQKHFTLYADLITCTGTCTSMDRYGNKARRSNLLSQITESSPITLITNAAINHTYVPIERLSDALLFGQTPKVGTNYMEIALDTDVFKASSTNLLDQI